VTFAACERKIIPTIYVCLKKMKIRSRKERPIMAEMIGNGGGCIVVAGMGDSCPASCPAVVRVLVMVP
jgi:hypothetical protein